MCWILIKRCKGSICFMFFRKSFHTEQTLCLAGNSVFFLPEKGKSDMIDLILCFFTNNQMIENKLTFKSN